MDRLTDTLDILNAQLQIAKEEQFARFEQAWTQKKAARAPWTFFSQPEEESATALIADLEQSIRNIKSVIKTMKNRK